MEIRVYPNLRRDSDLKALRQGVSGAHSVRQVGRGREFEKLREYLPGDGFDEIHWKATARRGRPITKVFQVERTQEIYGRLQERWESIPPDVRGRCLKWLRTSSKPDSYYQLEGCVLDVLCKAKAWIRSN